MICGRWVGWVFFCCGLVILIFVFGWAHDRLVLWFVVCFLDGLLLRLVINSLLDEGWVMLVQPLIGRMLCWLV